jgi:hypothetical protein
MLTGVFAILQFAEVGIAWNVREILSVIQRSRFISM